MSIVFAVIVPHPPILLPFVGSRKDREKTKKTIVEMKKMGDILKEKKCDKIFITSPHPDWGFDVPLYFIANEYRKEIKKILIKDDSPCFYFKKGKDLYNNEVKNSESKIAFIASGDLSHCLKKESPYGFHPDGLKFDEELIDSLKNKKIENILNLNNKYPNSMECGLRSFSFLLGVLSEYGKDYKTKIMSYQYPFGVGYLVLNFEL